MSAFLSNQSPSLTESSEPESQVEETSAELVEDDQVIDAAESGDDGEEDGGEAAAQDFDRAAVESRYGLSPGALADFENEESALTALRQGIDQVFISTLHQRPEPAPAAATDNTPGGDTDAQKKGKDIAAASLEALQKKVAELEGVITKQSQQQQEQVTREVVQQASTVIDGWSSPAYGTNKSRTFDQAKNLRELIGEVRTYTEFLRANGKPVPNVGNVLELVRLRRDGPAAPVNKPAQVGTPGGHKAPEAKGGATNIHSAVLGHFRK